MDSIQSLQDRTRSFARAARHFHAEKGDRKWSAEDNAVFNSLMDEADRSNELLELRRSAAESSPVVAWARERHALENYIRTGVSNTMSTTTPSQGGYTVPSLVVHDVMSSLKGYGWVRAVASETTTETGSTLLYPTSDGTAEVGERLAQNTLANSQDPIFGSADLTAWKYGSKLITAPIELLQDTAVDIIAYMGQRTMERIGRAQNVDLTVGTGSSQPMGLATAATVGKTGLTGQTTTIIYADVVDLVESVDAGALPMPHKGSETTFTPGVGFMVSQTLRKVVRKLTDSNNRPIWLPATANTPATLLEFPAYVNNDLATPAANAKSMLFGNFAKYLVRDVAEVKLYRFNDSAFTSKGQIGFLAIARMGGNLLDANAVRAYQNSAT